MKISLILTLAAVAALSACSSAPVKPDYECPLDDVAGAKCATVEQAYTASRSMKKSDSVTRVQSVFDRRVQQPAAAEKPFFQGQTSNFPEPGQVGAPVFLQPKVMRTWIAPYVDADGNLRSGEYTYFTTPGRWNYGDMRKPGAASGIFEPAKPAQLGFNPVDAAKTSKAPAKPAEPAKAGTSLMTPTTQGARPTTEPAGAITQPYQRLPSN